MGNKEESTILEKPDRQAEEREAMAKHQARYDKFIKELREGAVLSAREQVSERINRRHQNNVPRFYNFKK